MLYRWLLQGLLCITAVSCAGPSSYDRSRDSGANSLHGPGCTTALSPRLVDGRPVVVTRCAFPAHAQATEAAPYTGRFAGTASGLEPWVLQSGGTRKLVHLSRSGTRLEHIGDQELRATAEFRSYMDPRNIWQWGDQVSDADALAACRLMLADLRAGHRVDWQAQARGYLIRARRAAPAHATRPGSTSSPAAEPSGHAQPTPARPPGVPAAGTARKEDAWQVLDRGWKLRERLRPRGGGGGGGGSEDGGGILDLLADGFETVDAQIGAVAVLLTGTTIVITGVVIGGEAVELVLVTDGAMPDDMDLALKLARPLLEDLAGNLRQLHELAEPHGAVLDSAAMPSWLTADERIAYRKLVHRPMELLGRQELERIQDLQSRGGLPTTLRPGSPAHKAQRWANYRGRDGQWPFTRWSTTYDQNMVRTSDAHALADRLRDDLGWGEREVRVTSGDVTRVLDIADRIEKRGVEVKSGYVTYTADVAYEVIRDAKLIKKEQWSITWHVEGRFSEPLRRALRVAGIVISETLPNTPIKVFRT